MLSSRSQERRKSELPLGCDLWARVSMSIERVDMAGLIIINQLHIVAPIRDFAFQIGPFEDRFLKKWNQTFVSVVAKKRLNSEQKNKVDEIPVWIVTNQYIHSSTNCHGLRNSMPAERLWRHNDGYAFVVVMFSIFAFDILRRAVCRVMLSCKHLELFSCVPPYTRVRAKEYYFTIAS